MKIEKIVKDNEREFCNCISRNAEKNYAGREGHKGACKYVYKTLGQGGRLGLSLSRNTTTTLTCARPETRDEKGL